MTQIKPYEKEYYCSRCLTDISANDAFQYKASYTGPLLCWKCYQCGTYEELDTTGKMLNAARSRARKKDLPCTITRDDISIPERCPVLGIRLCPGNGKFHDHSASLDRRIPEKGYVPGNVRVISWKANRLKSNGTADEHQKIADWMRAEESEAIAS